MMLEPLNYLFPNDLHIHWSLMIVMYPYITGLVAGAFIVSSLYHVFGNEDFHPISRLALLTSLAFLLVATAPLLLHLGHPERALNIMISPNTSSAMAGFGFIYSFYLTLLVVEILLVYRTDIIAMFHATTGLRREVYRLLAFGVVEEDDKVRALNGKVVKILAAIGIPAACILHGYVGFLFGGVKANPWWSTPLMPVIFLFSAVVSGIAALVIFYQMAMRFRGERIDQKCISALVRWLWLFLIVTVSLELLEVVSLAYERAEEWEVISHLLTHQLSFSYISLQMIIGGMIPFILLMVTVLMDRYLDRHVRNTLSFVAASLLLIQVLAMRWNIVIGGQIFSKSFRGFREFHPHFLEKEGVLTAIVLVILPCVILIVLNKWLPAFKKGTPDLDSPVTR